MASSSSSSSSSNSGGPSLFQNPLAGWDLRRAGFALFTPMLLAFGGSVTPGVVSPGGGAAAVSVAVGRPPAAHAIDSIKVGSCLLQNCQVRWRWKGEAETLGCQRGGWGVLCLLYLWPLHIFTPTTIWLASIPLRNRHNTQLELARCILDPKCLANIICLNTCNGRPDEVKKVVMC